MYKEGKISNTWESGQTILIVFSKGSVEKLEFCQGGAFDEATLSYDGSRPCYLSYTDSGCWMRQRFHEHSELSPALCRRSPYHLALVGTRCRCYGNVTAGIHQRNRYPGDDGRDYIR